MKIFSPKQIAKIDEQTVIQQGIEPLDLMERASKRWVEMLEQNFRLPPKVLIVCGLGNNGGDGLAIARLFLQKGVEVRVIIVRYSEKVSDLFLANEQRLVGVNGEVINVNQIQDLPAVQENEVVVDAILGNGLSRPLDGLIAEVVDKINQKNAFAIAVDMPTGLFGESHTPEKSMVFKCKKTYTFQFVKKALLMPENYALCGEFKVVDIGLSEQAIYEQQTQDHFTELQDVQPVWPPLPKFVYKNKLGHLLVCGGSKGMMGAPILSAQAALCSGVGLCTMLVPEIGYDIAQTSLPQAMCHTAGENELEKSDLDLSKYQAISCGPGMGTSAKAKEFLKHLLEKVKVPLVLDADALNILAENPDLIKLLPENTILTPHRGELNRLIGKSRNDFDEIERVQVFAKENDIIVIRKCAHSAVVSPKGDVFYNGSGNTALAKGGSGDLLTGIIGAFLAQGKTPIKAAIAAVFVHGLMADEAIKSNPPHGLEINDFLLTLKTLRV